MLGHSGDGAGMILEIGINLTVVLISFAIMFLIDSIIVRNINRDKDKDKLCEECLEGVKG
jgi:1,4-dihydroxy-2-naphthoate octaprenyltransferase